MREYVKQRYKSYLVLAIGIIAGLLIAELFIHQPDYRTVWIVVPIGMLIGESFVFLKWRKKVAQEGSKGKGN